MQPIRKRLPLPVRAGANSIPEELRALPQWVARGREPGDKVPVDPRTGRNASVTDPSTWGTYEEATAAVQKHKLQGVGFVFTGNDPYVGVDLDKCRDPQTGKVAEWAQEIVQSLASFTEVSPSGTGLHIIVKGCWPPGANRKGPVEVYSQDRYFTVTGDVVDLRRTIAERTPELENLRLKHFGPAQKVRQPLPVRPKPEAPGSMTDAQIIALGQDSANNAKFAALWAGVWQRHFPSPSEAVLSLLNMLAQYAGRDRERVDRLFRQSGLYTPKWDEKRGDTTWGEKQLDLAMRDATTPQPPSASLDREAAIIAFRDLEKMDLIDRRHRMSPWLLEASLNLISAEAGTGKTFFALEVAGACADGRPAMEGKWECPQRCQVLYVDGEMLPSEIRTRGRLLKLPGCFKLLSKMLYEKGNPSQQLNLASPDVQDWLLKQAVALKVKLLVLDNIYSLIHGLDSNSDREWQPVTSWLLRLKAEGIAVIIVHHTNKRGEQLGTSSRVFNLDTHLVLKKPKTRRPHAAFSIEVQKSRHQMQGVDGPTYEFVDGLWVVTAAGEADAGGTDQTRRAIAQKLAEGVPQKQIAVDLGCTPSYVSQLKRSLLTDGLLAEDRVNNIRKFSLTAKGAEWMQRSDE